MYLLVKMPEINRKNALRGTQTTNQAQSNIFRCLEDGFEVPIMALKIDGTFLAVRNKEQRYLGVFRV